MNLEEFKTQYKNDVDKDVKDETLNEIFSKADGNNDNELTLEEYK